MARNQDTGRLAESTARDFLQQNGMRLVEANYHCPQGEIDLIMQDKDTTVFVEVRFRRNATYGSGAESVDYRKRKKLLASAAHYLQRNPQAANGKCRFDVVSMSADGDRMSLNWISNAFGIY